MEKEESFLKSANPLIANKLNDLMKDLNIAIQKELEDIKKQAEGLESVIKHHSSMAKPE